MTDRPFDPRKLPDTASMRQVPDLTEAVEGWRAWHVAVTLPLYGNPPKLRSITHGRKVDGGYWTPMRAAQAVCPRFEDAPHLMPENHVASMGCTCGFYSAKSFEHLQSIGYTRKLGSARKDDSIVVVIGKVACWGTVTEGNLGWRSQFCYPKALFVPIEAKHLVKPLREAYGVPVTLTLALAAMTPED